MGELGEAARGAARVVLAAGAAAAGGAACGDSAVGIDAAIDAAPARPAVGVPSVLEAADCGGAALVPRSGAPLVVSALRILSSREGIDLSGDLFPDNKLGELFGTNSLILSRLHAGTLAIPLELFDRGDDPDPCVKLALYRGACAVPPCDFTDDIPDAVSLDASSIVGGAPVSRLRDLRADPDGIVRLTGPGYLEIAIPFRDDFGGPGIDFAFPLSTSYVSGVLTPAGAPSVYLAGVVQAFRLGQLPAPVSQDLGTSPGDSELDAIFANRLRFVLTESSGTQGCREADIDMDGDGLESFCDDGDFDGVHRVNRCIDGNGVELHDGDNGIADCSQAMKHGRPRFVDGISAQLELAAKPAAFTP